MSFVVRAVLVASGALPGIASQDVALPAEVGPSTCAAAADLDGDRDVDLVIGQEGRPLVLLVNDGGGTFAVEASAFAASENDVRAMALLDADGDGDLDILLGGVDTLTRLWLNEGGLRFTDASARLPENKLWATAIVVLDADGDGDSDAVVGDFAGRSTLFRNQGTRFTAEAAALPAGLRSVSALAAADLDGDRDLDLVFGQRPDAMGKGGGNRAARNDGKGRFTDATEAWMPSGAWHTTALALADLDGDGGLDLVCANRGAKGKEGARSTVHRWGGEGKFLGSVASRYSGAPAVSQAMALGDLDGDGDVDLVFGNDGPEASYLNDGKGVFRAGTLPRHDDDTRAVLLFDADGDGDLDVVTVNHGAPARLLCNGGAGNFTAGEAADVPARAEGTAASATRPADLGTLAGGKYASRATARAAVSEKKPRAAINAALRFLSDHQEEDGSFRVQRFDEAEGGEPALAVRAHRHDVGVTGLALLCFLAEGSHPRAGFHAETVERGARWLLAQQRAESGWFGPDTDHHAIYDHAIAALAVAEALVLSGDDVLREPLARALGAIEARRNRDGGFRYRPGEEPSDTSVTAWCTLAQLAGRDAGVPLGENVPARVLGFLRGLTDPRTGRTGYLDRGGLSSRLAGKHGVDFPPERSEAMTGAALFVRVALGDDPAQHEDMRAGLALLAAATPDRTGYLDPYSWFHMAHALSQLGGEEWLKWRSALHALLVEQQRANGPLVGSWDPKDPWGPDSGRIGTTALATLALQAEYRFARLVDPLWKRRVR